MRHAAARAAGQPEARISLWTGASTAPELDGVNLIPFVRGEKSGAPHDYLFWRWRSQAAVHDGRWKLILLGPAQRYLFDTAAPDGETRNLAAQHPDKVAALRAKLIAWRTEVGAVMPTPNPNYDPNAKPEPAAARKNAKKNATKS